jgi:hypothetical protein
LRPVIAVRRLVLVAVLSALTVVVAGAATAYAVTPPPPSASTYTRVPSPGEFSWRPVACDVNAELTIRVRDAYPGPLPMTGTLTAPHGQPVVYDLRPGNNDILAPATAISLTLFVQVKGGEGAVAVLNMQHAQWAGLCPAASRANATPPQAAPPGLPSTGHPPSLSRRG